MFYCIMYPLRIPCCTYRMGCITVVWIISRFLSGTVYSYHVYFRFGSEFIPVFVKFYGSLMAHGYGSEKSWVVTARFNRGYVPRF